MTRYLRNAVFATLAMLLHSACATPMDSGSQCVVEPEFFDDRQRYVWREKDAVNISDDTGYVSPLVAQQLKQSVQRELASKGFVLADAGAPADLQVAVSLNTRRELQSFAIDSEQCIDCWEPVYPAAGTRMTLRTVGFMAVDIYAQNRPIWRGWVERTLYPHDRDDPQHVLIEAVPLLLAEFPPGSAANQQARNPQ